MMVQNDDGHAGVFRLLYGLLGGYTVIYGDEQTVWILFPYFFDNGRGEDHILRSFDGGDDMSGVEPNSFRSKYRMADEVQPSVS